MNDAEFQILKNQVALMAAVQIILFRQLDENDTARNMCMSSIGDCCKESEELLKKNLI